VDCASEYQGINYWSQQVLNIQMQPLAFSDWMLDRHIAAFGSIKHSDAAPMILFIAS
jgi:hypothetical protein